MSVAIGIDFGSQNCVIAAVNRGGIEVLTNDLSNRATPSVAGFTNRQRSLGEAGYSKLGTNFRNTILFPTRFLGLSSNSSYIAEERKWITHSIESGRPGAYPPGNVFGSTGEFHNREGGSNGFDRNGGDCDFEE